MHKTIWIHEDVNDIDIPIKLILWLSTSEQENIHLTVINISSPHIN
jgi:hypothetical protein